jgi:hypothetical protein
MNWRLLTIINAAIALVTVGAVIFVIATRPRTKRSRDESARLIAQGNASSAQRAEQREQHDVELLDDISQARVDDLGAVPANELTRLMGRATPEQLAAMAFKFNDAPTDARTFGGMAVFFQAWTELDPKAALAGAFRLKDVALRKLAATTVVTSISPSSAPDLITFLAEHPDKDLADECKNDLLEPLVESWSLLDPESASKFVDGLGDMSGSINYRSRTTIAYNWGTLDPTSALKWIATHKDDESIGSVQLYDQAITGWYRKDKTGVIAYLSQHLDEPGADDAAASVVAAMFSKDSKDATAWIDSLPVGRPRESAEYRVAAMWSSKDPSSAAQWLATLPATEQADLVSVIARNWVSTNWSDASRWLATLTGDVRDQAVAVAVNRENSTPVESLSLALWIKSDQMRNDAVATVIRDWGRHRRPGCRNVGQREFVIARRTTELLSDIAEAQNQNAETERIIITH